MSDHKYKLSYKVVEVRGNGEGITAEQAKEVAKEGYGSCDAVLICSIIFPEDGSYSVQFLPYDGRTDDMLSDKEMFKVWEMLAMRLAKSTTLDAGRLQLAQLVTQVIRDRVAAARAQAEQEN